MSFNQNSGTAVPTLINSSSTLLYGNAASANALTVQQLGAGGVVSFSNAAGAVMVMNNLGRVGIGAVNPSYPLDIQTDTAGTNSTDTALRLYSGAFATGTSNTCIRIEKGVGYGGVISGYLSQGVGSGLLLSGLNAGTQTDVMTITNNGRVGIGTVSPSYNLDCWTGTIQANQLRSPPGNYLTLVNGAGGSQIVLQGTTTAITGGTVYMTGGNVGIGTTSPSCPLDVSGSASVSVPSGYYFNYFTSAITAFSTSNQVVTIRSSALVVASGFLASSDSRIKNIELSTTNYLDVLNTLKVREYTYIDKINDSRKKVGFVAQEIEESLPNIVNKTTQVVPNIFRVADSVSSNVITLTNHTLKVGDKIRLVKNDNSNIDSSVVATTESTFQIESELNETKIFVYGTEVQDFMSIEYNQIFSVAVGAIQELSTENTALKTQLASLDARLTALEQQLKS